MDDAPREGTEGSSHPGKLERGSGRPVGHPLSQISPWAPHSQGEGGGGWHLVLPSSSKCYGFNKVKAVGSNLPWATQCPPCVQGPTLAELCVTKRTGDGPGGKRRLANPPSPMSERPHRLALHFCFSLFLDNRGPPVFVISV